MMDLGKRLSKKVGNVVDRTVKTSVTLIGKGIQQTPLKGTGDWVEELAPLAGKVTGNTVKVTGAVIDGTVTAGVGLAKKDDAAVDRGVADLKHAGTYIVKDIGSTISTVAKNGVEVVKGVAYNDRERTTSGFKTLSKAVVAGSSGMTEYDAFKKESSEETPIVATKPPFEATPEIENFPTFTVFYEVNLIESLYGAETLQQVSYCNKKLDEALKQDEQIGRELSLTELDRINLSHGMTPEHYVWHHDVTLGRMQLVSEEEHALKPHSSASVLWNEQM
ncbi:HNH endonuclease [Kurthia senegalensis]|uniref:HNH endonuclease n=1 Tax=Kurthia senegalensis TaxID=1033740 RepID=UPI0002D2955C|nr:HNH endonuclease [Kurthia senegalensis]